MDFKAKYIIVALIFIVIIVGMIIISVTLKPQNRILITRTIVDSDSLKNCPKGETGIMGPIGKSGPMGIKGLMGDTGLIGPTGMKGDVVIGPQGLQGPRGANSDDF